MFKGSIFLFKVHDSFKVTFNLIISGDVEKTNLNARLINKFSFDGNDYIKINPYPFITVDITSRSDKKEGWNNNLSFKMNRQELFKVIQRVQRIHSRFTTVKDLFYYDVRQDNKLVVSQELAEKYKEVFRCGDKTIMIKACVVENEESKQIYEGVFLIINRQEFYTFLTYDELGYFLYELKQINMSNLSMTLIETIRLSREIESHEIPKKPPIPQKEEEEIIDRKVRARIDDPNTIPEI